jgi:phosphoenolpyruvate-protein kinase (PTS system EI component)
VALRLTNFDYFVFRITFEEEYQKQVDLDVKELKNIGELEHNFETMTQKISDERMVDFRQLKQQIVNALRENDVYERDESVRKILITQVNTIKDCKWSCPLLF